MLKAIQSVYYCSGSELIAQKINLIEDKLAVKLVAVEAEKIQNVNFIERIVSKNSVLIIDWDTCKAFTSIFSNINNQPEILVLINEVQKEELSLYELDDNISIVLIPGSDDMLFFYLEQTLRRAKSRSHNLQLRQRHRDLFDESSTPQVIVDPFDGTILEINNAAYSLFSTDAKSLHGKKIDDLHPECFSIIASQISEMKPGAHQTFNLKYIKSKSEVKDLEYNYSLISVGQKYVLFIRIEDVTQKLRVYEYFYQQTEMLRNTLESIDDLLFSLNRDGDFIEYYQPSGGAHLAVSSDVFIGKNIYDVGFPLDVARKYIQTIEQVIEDDKPEQIDYYLEAFGSRLWYNAKISPRKNAFGLVDGVTVLCRDVTRQKKTEETLKKARDFYLTLLADFPSMVWKTNSARHPDYFNKTWLDFTGNTLEEEILIDWNEKIHPADHNNFLTSLVNAYRTRDAFQIEHRLKHKSGDYHWVINAGRPFYNFDGNFAGYIGSCYDISERRKAEDMLYLQRSAMESALEGILIIRKETPSYPVIYANAEYKKLTGLTEDQIIGSDFLQVFGCSLPDEIIEELVFVLDNGRSFKGEFSCQFSGNGEEQQWRLLYVSPVRDKKEQHYIAVLNDITESKRVEKTLLENNRQLRKTNEELDSFVYSTSHELRSPLTSILGVLNLLETDIDHDDRSEYISMIRESVSRLDKIIHDIIDYSRNSRIDVVYERIDFVSMVPKVIQNHKYIDDFDKIRFSVKIDDSKAFFSDRKRVQIILNSFISNSLRFHNFDQDDPFIEITITTSPISASISVEDNGTGIHEKHMPRIFEMFYRGNAKSKGSGIGLYIVKEIIDKLDGQIQVKTEPEKGTKFTVEIPNYLNKNYNIVSLSASQNII